MNDINRSGNFSSSQMYRLVGKGSRKMTDEELKKWKEENPKSRALNTKSYDTPTEPFLTYIEEKVMERNLGRSIQSENSARSTAWGSLVEEYAFDKLGLEYSLVSKERFYHEEYRAYWNGMPDLKTDELVGDIKCPWTLKSFCKLVKNMKDPELLKENHPDYYWQLVSNAILCGKDKAMLVVYCPYKEELDGIRELARQHIGDQNNRFSFINWAEDEELPFIIKGKKYNDLNVCEFIVPQEDKDILTMRVKMAIDELNKQLDEDNG